MTHPSPEQGEALKDRLTEIIRNHLTAVYHCTRVWSAWSVGTMGEDDFIPADESSFAEDLADEIVQALSRPPAAEPGAGQKCMRCDNTGAVHRADGEYLGDCPDCQDPSQPAAADSSYNWGNPPFPRWPAETVDSMAEIGEAFMEALPKDYCWLSSPAEVIAHLQNKADDAVAERDALAADNARLKVENERLRSDAAEDDQARTKMRDILHATANALKGDPGPLKLHSWHDLPAIAKYFDRLASFARHHHQCPIALAERYIMEGVQKCDCGFEAALQEPAKV